MKIISSLIILSLLVIILSPVTISVVSAQEGYVIAELDVCNANGSSSMVNGDYHWLCMYRVGVPSPEFLTFVDISQIPLQQDIIPFTMERPPKI